MKILYRNATVVTQNLHRDIIEQGYVIVQNKYVTEVGFGEPVGNFDEVINLEGKWLLPGFVNSHVHLGESVYLSFIDKKLSLSGYLERTEEIYASNEGIGKNRELVCRFSLYGRYPKFGTLLLS